MSGSQRKKPKLEKREIWIQDSFALLLFVWREVPKNICIMMGIIPCTSQNRNSQEWGKIIQGFKYLRIDIRSDSREDRTYKTVSSHLQHSGKLSSPQRSHLCLLFCNDSLPAHTLSKTALLFLTKLPDIFHSFSPLLADPGSRLYFCLSCSLYSDCRNTAGQGLWMKNTPTVMWTNTPQRENFLQWEKKQMQMWLSPRLMCTDNSQEMDKEGL